MQICAAWRRTATVTRVDILSDELKGCGRGGAELGAGLIGNAAADEKKEGDRKDGLEYSQSEVLSQKPSDFGVYDANRGDADGLMHLDLLPIN